MTERSISTLISQGHNLELDPAWVKKVGKVGGAFPGNLYTLREIYLFGT